MRTNARIHRWVPVVLASLLALAGCGGAEGGSPPPESGADVGKIEAELAKRVKDSGVGQAEVSCPDDAASGAALDCTVSGSGGVEGSISVTLDSPDGSTYSYEGEVGNEDVQGMTIELSGSVR